MSCLIHLQPSSGPWHQTLPCSQPFPSAMPILTPCCHSPCQPQPQPLRGKTPVRCFGSDPLVHSLNAAGPTPNLSKQESTIKQTSLLLPACLGVFLVLQISILDPQNPCLLSPGECSFSWQHSHCCLFPAQAQCPVIASPTNEISSHQGRVLCCRSTASYSNNLLWKARTLTLTSLLPTCC